MGEIVPFKKKRTLEFPMVINESGIGINPNLVKHIHVSKNNTIYFAFDTDEECTPQCALITPSYIDACTSATYLRELLKNEFDTDVEVHYDEC